jgi:hypothetical protein
MRDKTSDDLAAEEEDYKRFLLESMAVSIWCMKNAGTMTYSSVLILFFFDRITRLERTPLLIGRTIEITRMLTRRKPFWLSKNVNNVKLSIVIDRSPY